MASRKATKKKATKKKVARKTTKKTEWKIPSNAVTELAAKKITESTGLMEKCQADGNMLKERLGQLENAYNDHRAIVQSRNSDLIAAAKVPANTGRIIIDLKTMTIRKNPEATP